jgi:hypothetical protein
MIEGYYINHMRDVRKLYGSEIFRGVSGRLSLTVG